MLTLASFLAALTIAGAFWVGVLAARRLKDWGENQRVLDEAEAPYVLLGANGGSAPDGPDPDATLRIRALVAERLDASRRHASRALTGPNPSLEHELVQRDLRDGLTLDALRVGDIVLIEAAQADLDGDYQVEGLVHLREGEQTTWVVCVADGEQRRWLIGGAHLAAWFLVEPAADSELTGEPPRVITRGSRSFSLERRGQAAAASLGAHGRPAASRVGTYVYRAGSRDVLWLERWGELVLLGEGRELAPSDVGYLPGS
jgi:hypothetical protein